MFLEHGLPMQLGSRVFYTSSLPTNESRCLSPKHFTLSPKNDSPPFPEKIKPPSEKPFLEKKSKYRKLPLISYLTYINHNSGKNKIGCRSRLF